MHWSRHDRKMVNLFLFPALFFVLFVQAGPLLYSIYLSFQDWILLTSSSPQGFVGLANFKNATSDPVFIQSLKFTGFLTLSTVPFQLILGTLLAFLTSGQSRFLQISRAFLVLPMVVAPVAIGTLWRLMFNDTAGPINNHLLNFLHLSGP